MTDQKQIIINAATAATGGGLIVALDIIKALCINPQYKITLICPDINIYHKLSVEATKIYIPRLILKFYARWLLDYIWLRRTITRISPDLVVSLGNLPAITSLKQVIFNDNAFVSEQNLKGFILTTRELFVHSLRKWLFHRRLKYVNLLVVQTELEKEKFKNNFRRLPAIKCLTPLLPWHIHSSEKLHFKLPAKKPNQIRLGCLSFVHGHKNIGILSEVLDIAEANFFPLQIVFTLSPAKSGLSKKLNLKLKNHLTSGTAINLGKIRPDQISDLMSQLDGLILPSLNESFSLNYIEAMHFGKQLLVSDRPFAKKICGNNFNYFDPLSSADIFKAIVNAFSVSGKHSDISGNSAPLSLSIEEQLYNIINQYTD